MHPLALYSSTGIGIPGFNQTFPVAGSSLEFEPEIRPMSGEELSEYFHRRAGPEYAAFAIGRLFSETFSSSAEPVMPLKNLDKVTKQWLREEGFNLNRDVDEEQRLGWFTSKITPLGQAIIKKNYHAIVRLLERVSTVGSGIILMGECLDNPIILKTVLDAKKTSSEDIINVLDVISDQLFYPGLVKDRTLDKILVPDPKNFKILRAALKAIPTDSPCLYHLPIGFLKELTTKPKKKFEFMHKKILLGLRFPRLEFSSPIKQTFGLYSAAVLAAHNRNYDLLWALIDMGVPLSPDMPKEEGQITIDSRYCPFSVVISQDPNHHIVDFMIDKEFERNSFFGIEYLFSIALRYNNEQIADKIRARIEERNREIQ